MPPLTSRAQMMRAILLARATVTSIFGLRANICASHDPWVPHAGWPVEPRHSPQ